MPYRNKTYVCFDADNDMPYYRTLQMWKANEKFDFNFSNAHEMTDIRPWSTLEAKKASLRIRMANSKILVVLVGDNTRFCHTYVRWEIDLALKKDLPIIVVNLSGDTAIDRALCPAILRGELALHVPFKEKVLTYALEHWPDAHENHRLDGETGPYHYKESVYKKLGIPRESNKSATLSL